MLKGIDPLLTGELLGELDALGHGDSVAVVDANFPARRIGRRVVALPGIGIGAALAAIASVLPIEGNPLFMAPDEGSAAAHEDMRAALEGQPTTNLDRFAFYEESKKAEIVILTGETRPYGNALLTKGVVAVDRAE
ncbi:MAG: hypothetical protein LBR58_10435 [Propionibacteriaceae bacterium]|jgi:L-fucose mutarotase|nr:hypothetical protein [Propionibacteriaceae bacterium]